MQSKRQRADGLMGSMLAPIFDGVAAIGNSAANIVSAANNKSMTTTTNTNFSIKNATGITVAVMGGLAAIVVIIIVARRNR